MVNRSKRSRLVTPPSNAQRARGKLWVCKSDVIACQKCRYAFWLVDKGEVDLDAILGDLHNSMLERGIAFEREVVREATPIAVSAKDVPAFLQQSTATLLQVPMLENRELRLYGKPDGIEARRGALVPVEVKWHKNVRRTDLLELAFYWLLLEPYRTRRSRPRGQLILRSSSGDEDVVDVQIEDRHFDSVRLLIDEVRHIRHRGVIPEMCSCEVCMTRPEVVEIARKRNAASLVYGIAAERAKALASLGVRTLDDIIACDDRAVVTGLAERKHFVTAYTVREWKHHARSYVDGLPRIFGPDRLDLASFIAVDFEYDSFCPGSIYLIGAAAVQDAHVTVKQWWGDTGKTIAKNLEDFLAWTAAQEGFPIITWAGDMAEVPELTKAAEMYNLESEARAALSRQRDVFRFVERNVRLPVPDLSLKLVASYFRIPRASTIGSGMEAMSMWIKYQRSRRAATKKRIRNALLEYNRDDLHALIEVTRRIVALSNATPVETEYLSAAGRLPLCAHCGLDFSPMHEMQKYCSPRCRRNSGNKRWASKERA